MESESTGELFARAAGGDQDAWDSIVDRFAGLVWSVARSHRLDHATAADVSQTTWLRLVENLDRIREPERLKGWLATTARNEALRLIRHKERNVPTTAIEALTDPVFEDPVASLAQEERAASVATAYASLGDECRLLLRLLTSDPPLTYEEISAVIDRPVGSIGPTRARCLEQLRRRLAALDAGEAQSQTGKA